MPARRRRKRGKLVPLGEVRPAIRQKAATARGRVLYRLAAPGVVVWLVYHDAGSAPQGLSEGLYWFRKGQADEVQSRQVADFPETSLEALSQLETIGLLDSGESSGVVDLQHPIARYYREPSPRTLPLNTRVDPERFLRAIRRSWATQPGLSPSTPSATWDPFAPRETAAITFQGSPEFLSRAPHALQAVFDQLANLPPLAQDYVLERMLPGPGLGVYVDAPPGISGQALLDWGRRQRGSPPQAPPSCQPLAEEQLVRNRDDWLILCSETRLLSILKARVLWWRERDGRHRVSLQGDLVMDRRLTGVQQREVSASILAWAGIRFGELVEGLARMLGQYDPAEGSVVAQVLLHRDIPIPHVTVEERMDALLSSADHWDQVGPGHRRGVAGCLGLELRGEP